MFRHKRKCRADNREVLNNKIVAWLDTPMGSVVRGASAPNLFTLYPNCKHSTGDTSLPGTGPERRLVTNLSLPSRIHSVFVTSSQLERGRGERECPLKLLTKCFPCKSFVSLGGPKNKWNFNDLRRDVELFNIHELGVTCDCYVSGTWYTDPDSLPSQRGESLRVTESQAHVNLATLS